MTAFNLPVPLATYVAATNASDIGASMATFADGALVNDHRDEFVDLSAIRDWAQKSIARLSGCTCPALARCRSHLQLGRSGSGHSGGSGYHGGYSGGSTSAAAAIARGSFGAAGFHAARS